VVLEASSSFSVVVGSRFEKTGEGSCSVRDTMDGEWTTLELLVGEMTSSNAVEVVDGFVYNVAASGPNRLLRMARRWCGSFFLPPRYDSGVRADVGTNGTRDGFRLIVIGLFAAGDDVGSCCCCGRFSLAIAFLHGEESSSFARTCQKKKYAVAGVSKHFWQ
jgi:hypothetical protein